MPRSASVWPNRLRRSVAGRAAAPPGGVTYVAMAERAVWRSWDLRDVEQGCGEARRRGRPSGPASAGRLRGGRGRSRRGARPASIAVRRTAVSSRIRSRWAWRSASTSGSTGRPDRIASTTLVKSDAWRCGSASSGSLQPALEFAGPFVGDRVAAAVRALGALDRIRRGPDLVCSRRPERRVDLGERDRVVRARSSGRTAASGRSRGAAAARGGPGGRGERSWPRL